MLYLASLSGYYSECGWLLGFSCFSKRPSIKLMMVLSDYVKQRMVYSDYIKQRILFYHRSDKSLQQIVLSLVEKGP